jgi:cytochrome d ubiquinol oxidase subunit II
MHLSEVPLVLMLAGLAAYAMFGGADFGAGFWQLTGGRGERGREIREHAHHAMGPVWEANHVWLIFVLVICWTCYPTTFGSITSTLAVPFFIAGVGIILRGTAYALRSGTATLREQRRVELLSAGSSILTPFALGAVIGGIASGRVPVGNAKGDLVTSWLNGTSILVGVLSVAVSAYLAAVYLAADAAREGKPELVRAFRARALAVGVVAGAVAFAGLGVAHGDARPLWDGLTGDGGLAAVVVSAVAGVATMALVWRDRFEAARATAALAVAAIVAGWGVAQRPDILPGLTIDRAAASRSTIVAVLVSVAIGALVVLPSLAFLFGLVLRGRFDPEAAPAPGVVASPRQRVVGTRLAPFAAVCLAVGVGLTMFVENPWARLAGVIALLAFVACGFIALAPAIAADDSRREL